MKLRCKMAKDKTFAILQLVDYLEEVCEEFGENPS